jgi:DNA-binding XRE family transcriptional regulator
MSTVQRLLVEGARYVVLREAEYEQLCREARRFETEDESDLPALPKPDRRGRVPAIEFSRVSLARDLIRHRKALALSQQQLAKLAGVRQETISRIESGKHTVTVRTYDKIFEALDSERAKRRKAGSRQ